jgi:MFS family permease
LIDSITFAVSTLCLWAMRVQKTGHSADGTENESVWNSILTGIKFLYNDKPLWLMFLVITALNFLFVGPILVGIPVLADQRLPEGAVAFGLLTSAYAGGNLVGYLLSGSLPRPSGKTMTVFLLGLLTAFGVVLAAFGFIQKTWIDFSLMLILGMGNGYISLILFTWMQLRTPKTMLGRMMSMLLLSNNGLVPVSQAVAGAVSKWSLTMLFAGAGALILVVAVITAFQPQLRVFSDSMISETNGMNPEPVLEE